VRSSLSKMSKTTSRVLFLYSLLLSVAHCATKTYDFEVSWVSANPDGLQERSVIGINGQWPIPSINVTKGDQVVINLKNSLGNESTSLHFHGLYQNKTTHMDGAVQVSQCEITPGSTFTYNFTVSELPATTYEHTLKF
jgi:iron transport multicopper oxidase